MNAGERLRVAILERRRGRYLCPAHKDRSPSLNLKIGDNGRVLVYCFAGCPLQDILSSCGLAYSDLFPDSPSHRRAIRRRATLQARAERGLELWTSRQLLHVCQSLRLLDELIQHTVALFKVMGEESESYWSLLQFAYVSISRLEFDFERLNSRNATDHLQVFREVNA